MNNKKTYAAPLPGETKIIKRGSALVDEVLRVDHAGEYGAKRIYAGQLAVLKGKASEPVIRHMAEQEQVHLDKFNQLVKERGARPTALMPIWHVLGYALGAGTALLGEKAAMACTVAVEHVIADHYAEQAAELAKENEPELVATIEQFRAEEMEHHDTGLAHDAEQAPFYTALSTAVGSATKLAIWLSKRI